MSLLYLCGPHSELDFILAVTLPFNFQALDLIYYHAAIIVKTMLNSEHASKEIIDESLFYLQFCRSYSHSWKKFHSIKEFSIKYLMWFLQAL